MKSGHFIFGEHMFYCHDILLEKSVLYRPGAAYYVNRRIMFSLIKLHLGVSHKIRYRNKKTNKQQQQKTHTQIHNETAVESPQELWPIWTHQIFLT